MTAAPVTESQAAPLLSVRGLRVTFGGQAVVHGIDFDIAPGEKLALVGESGSGKTVSALSLLRLVEQARVSGSARFQGQDLLTMSEAELRAVRGRAVACIFQEPMTALNPLFTIGDQIAEVLTLKMGLPGREAGQRVLDLLASTGLPDPVRQARAYPHQLSGGQRQRAMIAMALASEPALLLADEPTTALDATVRTQILDLLGELQSRLGMAVLMITHDLNLVRRFADRVAVMEQGRLVEQGPVDEVFAWPQHAYTRRLIDSRPRRDLDPVNRTAETLVEAQALTVDYAVPLPGIRGWFRRGRFAAVKGADFALKAGSTLAIVGESGSGKTTVALAALGLLPHGGRLQAIGSAWADAAREPESLKRLRQAIQVVFQDPYSSLSPRMTIEQVVGEGLHVHAPDLAPEARRTRVLAALREVGLVRPDESDEQAVRWLQRYPHEFSGGQRQRIAIARALVVQPRVLVLDEPTSALDVTVQQQVIELLQGLQRERGLAFLLITHDIAVVRAMAHEVVVMREGEVVEAGPADAVLDAPGHDYTRSLMAAAEA